MESLIRKVSVLELTLILLFTLACLALTIGTETTRGQQSESGWIVGSPMPTPRTEVTSVGLGDGIYIIGGFNSTDRNCAIVEMYNITSDS